MIYMWFSHVLIWFDVALYMIVNILLTYADTFLEFVKDHFASPPAQNFGLLCKCDFPIFLNLPEQFLIFDILDFLLLRITVMEA